MDLQQLAPLTLALGKASLAAGTTSTLSTTGTLAYAIAGKAFSKTAITNGATPTTDAATGLAFTGITANNGTVFVVGLDATGALKVTQGAVQALDVSGNFIVAPQMPSPLDTVCPIGYIVVKAGSTAVGSWTFGVNNNSGVTGLTYTFVDTIGYPARPQVA